MTTIDCQNIPLSPGMVVYCEVVTLLSRPNDPPVMNSEWVPGKVQFDGMTALFDLPMGKTVKHLSMCRVYKNCITL